MIPSLLLIQKVALVGGTLHTMVPGAAPAVGTILIDYGLIEAIGPDVKLPAEAKQIQLKGKHVIPGLIDGMVNFDPDQDRLYLSCGVTLVRETGADLTQMLAERDTYARDRSPGPALWIAGAILDGAPPSTLAAIVMTTREEAVDKASRLLNSDAGDPIDYFSYYPGLPPDAWKAVIELAHRSTPPRQVWGMLPRGLTLEDALKAGQDGLFHIDFLLPAGKAWKDVTDAEIEAIAARVGESRLAVTPTLALYAKRLLRPPEKPPELKYIGPIQVQQWLADVEQRRAYFQSKPEAVEQGLNELKRKLALLKALHQHKVALVPGSGCGMAPWLMPGEALLDELSLWTGQSVGISQAEALMLATRGSAERIGALRTRGTLENGKWADLVVTSADPEKDLATLRQPDYVAVRGRMLSGSELEALLGNLAERQKELQALAFKPLALKPPTAPPGELLLSGMVETRYQNQRLSGERFAVSRMSDGALVFAGRTLTLGSASVADTECESMQKIQGGRVVEFALTVTTGPRVITMKGTLAGGTLNIERRMNGVYNDMPRIRESSAFIEYGSVLTDLILGQCVKPGEFNALFLADFEVATSEKWDLRVDPANGNHYLRGPIGERAVSFAADGAPKLSLREVGNGSLTRTLVEDTPVKSGLPVPKKENPPGSGAPPKK